MQLQFTGQEAHPQVYSQNKLSRPRLIRAHSIVVRQSGGNSPILLLPPSIEVSLRFLAEQIYPLGSYPLFHLPAELVAGANPLDRIEGFARLSPCGDFIRANADDQFRYTSFSSRKKTQDDRF